ncbi:MAG TPA: sigma factor, partial [Macellibacteroides fermentans]|nr:sigma factor [Macellibacteroides fermentans]
MEAKEDDIFLLKLISKGNEQAFKLLFETYFTPLCRFVRLYVKEGTQAEEIVLEVFENVWELREILHIKVTFKAYLFQSARNRALNYIRNNEKFIWMNDMSIFNFAETDSKL